MYLRWIKRKEIDHAFAAMGEDSDYHNEARSMAADFEASDWEALELAEKADVKSG